MVDKLNFTIPGKPEYIQMVRLAIGSVAGKFDFDVEKVDDIQVAVGEACKLVSCHGFEGFCEKFEIAVEVSEEKIQVTISDLCTNHCIEKQYKQCANCPEDGNMAVFVINSLMDETEIQRNEDGSKSIKMVKVK